MKKEMKTIGVLTSGGDAPGMNAAVRAVTRYALSKGVRVMGIEKGYTGLIYNEMRLLGAKDVSNIMSMGGTILYSDRCPEFKTEEGMQKAIENCKANGIDGIVAIGGDGTFHGATKLSDKGIPCIGIPATIDNDITASEYSIGFDTAMNTVVEMVDRLRDTCESHARCDVVEVMGRGAGYIALEAGIAVGASAIVVAEMPFDEQKILDRFIESRLNGKRTFIVLVAEGVPGYAEKLAVKIEEYTKQYEKEFFSKPENQGLTHRDVAITIETKFARLAHVQRGGSPTLRDRLISTKMGCLAVENLVAGNSNLVVCQKNGVLTTMPIFDALMLDKLYKNGSITEEERARIGEAAYAQMLKECEEKRERIKYIYGLADDISKFEQ